MEKHVGLSVEQNASGIALHLDQNIRDAFEQHQFFENNQEVSPLELEIYSDAAWEPSQRLGLPNRPSLLSAMPSLVVAIGLSNRNPTRAGDRLGVQTAPASAKCGGHGHRPSLLRVGARPSLVVPHSRSWAPSGQPP
jgi:hypothetical protein